MPIEIKELHIRVSVQPPTGGQPAGERTAPGGSGPSLDEKARKALIDECVESVLDILQRKKER